MFPIGKMFQRSLCFGAAHILVQRFSARCSTTGLAPHLIENDDSSRCVQASHALIALHSRISASRGAGIVTPIFG